MKAPNIPIAQHIKDVQRFAGQRKSYIEFSETLKKILDKAGARYAPLSIVQARAKTVSSFAEKIIRKDKYIDPLAEVTDLCGARIIVHFQSQVLKICQFIKENFIIDEANSLDVSSKLRDGEFGYLSIHYIVTPPEGAILDIPIARDFLNLKAEIQVRTLLQHAWADISHDRIYKSNFSVPKRWKRESARLAAVLEKADDAFAGMSETLDAYSTNYSILLCKDKLDAEIQTLTMLLTVEPDKQNMPMHALKLGKAQAAKGDWPAVVKLLQDYLPAPQTPDLQIDYAFAICQVNKQEVQKPNFSKGQKQLQEAATAISATGAITPDEALDATRRQARAWHLLGVTWSWIKGKDKNAKAAFRRAYEITPTNPYYFLKFLEYEIKGRQDLDFLVMLKPGILEAIHTCRNHIEIGIELFNAYMAIAKAYFILSMPDECLNAYARTIDILFCKESCILPERLEEELLALDNLGSINAELYEQCMQLFHLARWKKFANEDSKKIIMKKRLYAGKWRQPVLIIAGGAEFMNLQTAHHYHDLIREALDYYQGTVISGGTTSGIPGEVALVAHNLVKQGYKDFTLIGYIPKKLPQDAKISPDYDELVHTDARNFSARELIAYWSDLLIGGVDPVQTLVMGINGGRIADLEYRLALAFGAVVGLVQNSGRAAAGLLADPDWKNHPHIVVLADDAKIIWAFTHQQQPVQLNDQQIEQLAPQAHEYYRQKRIEQKNTSDKAMLPWEKLPDSLVASNKEQIRFIEKTIEKIGLSIRVSAAPKLYPFTTKQKDEMAELEHARWCVERSLDGWQYGPVKDVDNKINPSLVAWDKLSAEIKAYDEEAVYHFQEILNKAGFEIYEAAEKK
jgi:ppGpp synthetase/RelA/SpoT-type nucleotidyltranferase